jgi:hypothetical protein
LQKKFGQTDEQRTWRKFFKRKNNGVFFKPSQKELDLNPNIWSMTHSHYATMGGFAIIPGERRSNTGRYVRGYTQSYAERLTLTTDGIEFLANMDPSCLKIISKSEIMDKSKGNRVTKALVCLQAFWFCVQCIARITQGLKISLLELNTFAHALCTILIYFLWWNKPLDIDEPTVIQAGEATSPAIALLCMASSIGRNWKTPDYHEACVRPTFGQEASKLLSQGDMTFARTKPPPHGGANLLLGKELYGFYICSFDANNYYDEHDYEFAAREQAANPLEYPIYLSLDEAQVHGFKLAGQAINKYGITAKTFPVGDNLLVKRIPDRPSFGNAFASFDNNSHKFLLGFTFAGLVYGGLHLSAWNAPFPSPIQRLLWRISGLVLVSSGPALFLQLFGNTQGALLYKRVSHYTRHSCAESTVTCLGCLTIATPWYISIVAAYVIYGLARVFLVIECFVTLWYLPKEVFEVLNWTQFLPHIS